MLSEVPEGWQRQRLTECFDVKSSKRVLQKQWRKQGVPFYRGREITALSEHGSVDNELFIDEELYREFAEKSGVPSKGDILITAIGTIGNTYCVKESEKFYFKDASVLWLSKKTDVNSFFINYWLNSTSFRSQLDSGNGTTVDSLTIKQLSNSYLLIPPLTEQKRIAEVLSSLDESIQATQRLIEQTERVKQGLMEELLTGGLGSEAIERGEVPEGWQVIQLGFEGLQLLDGDRGKNYPKSTDFSDSGFCLFLSAKNITKQGLELKELQFISEEKHNSLRKGSVERGDIVITTRGTVGNVAYFNESCPYEVCRINSGMAIIRNCSEIISNEYLYVYLASKVVDAQVKNITHGSAQPALTLKTLKTIKLALPAVEMQESIVQKVKSLSDVSELNKTKLGALEQIKKGLMEDLLTGKVRTV